MNNLLLQKVKLINTIPLSDTENDEILERIIELYKELAEEYCNQKFDDEIPSGVVKFIAKCIKYGQSGNLASRSMGTVSYSYVTDLPQSAYKHLAPFRKLRW
ncbi:phage head-tail connector protein [Mammaliicoccus sciuri]|uniref:phage head-tail connector protein n=1 Tax=Mammaliicoccus sciuri TaxID=1296 RepID=UPI0016273AB2|nr:phage head-tail connector protein [Mammaliicoccus sciuri]